MPAVVGTASAAGSAIVIVLGLAMAAILQQTVLPDTARHRPDAGVDAGGATPSRAHPSRSSARRPPAEPATLLTRKVQEAAVAGRGAQVRRAYGVKTLADPVVRLSRIDHRKTWAFGTVAIPPPRGMTAMPDSSIFLAHDPGNGWTIALTGTAGFASLLRQAPAAVLSKAESTPLRRYDASAAPAHDAGLMLPWNVGQSWSLLATDTGVAGFDGGDGHVLAAGEGRLYRLCSSSPGRGLLLLIHANGLATEYYQLDQITPVPDGGLVKRGDYLGRTSTDQPCGGGAAPRRLARFALRTADGVIPLDTVQIGGWTLHETPAEAYAQHGGTRIAAGDLLLNFGIGPSPAPAPSKAARTAKTKDVSSRAIIAPAGGVVDRT